MKSKLEHLLVDFLSSMVETTKSDQLVFEYIVDHITHLLGRRCVLDLLEINVG